jgi:hypothetical protein
MRPRLLFLLAVHFRERFPKFGALARWRPFALVGHAAVGDRKRTPVLFLLQIVPGVACDGWSLQNVFLPLIPSPPPLDRYVMWSLNHILDLANVLLLVGLPAVPIVVGLLTLERRSIDWNHPRVMFFSIAALYPLVFFLTVNPVLSMPRDWDLYALFSAPLLLSLAAMLYHRRSTAWTPWAAYAVAFVCFPLAFIAVNSNRERVSRRLETIGDHAYRTYKRGSRLPHRRGGEHGG